MSETLKGLEGEYIALAAITAMGWKATHCPMDRIDVLAFLDQIFLRIQVKTASLLGNKDGRSPRHHFQMGHGCKAKHLPTREDYDVLCLVSPMPDAASSSRLARFNSIVCDFRRHALLRMRNVKAGIKRLITFWR